MEYFFRFMHPLVAVSASVIVVIIACLRWFYYKEPYIQYSLVTTLKKINHHASFSFFKVIPFFLYFSTLLLLALLMARPQLVHSRSKIQAEGVSIMMVMDASGSMQCFDDLHDRRSRFDVAKTEGIRFIEKREHDQIGLVLFGKDAISRCPLTCDKSILKDIINDAQLGVIDPDGTVLSMAICMAAKRLQSAQTKTKVMILLTDGEPTPGLDIAPQVAVALAKKCGIKIYTIGIGGEHGGLWQDPLFGIRRMGFRLNKDLLKMIAHETGGEFFLAQKPEDMNNIYSTIDKLEKTSYQAPIFTHYEDVVTPFVSVIFIVLFLALCATTFLWFSL